MSLRLPLDPVEFDAVDCEIRSGIAPDLETALRVVLTVRGLQLALRMGEDRANQEVERLEGALRELVDEVMFLRAALRNHGLALPERGQVQVESRRAGSVATGRGR